MESRIRMKEYYRKIKDQIKGRMKKAMDCNWPELSNYCGCCNLSTGIYIRSAIMIVLTIITIGINGSILQYLYEISYDIQIMNTTEIDEYWGPGTDWDSLYFIYRAIIIYYILWICFKVVYTFIVVWTIYAVFKKNTKMLEMLLYISIPNLVLEFLLSLAGSRLLDYSIRIILVICILSEVYNILALNSEYKKIRGISRIVPEHEMDQINPNNLASPTNENVMFRPERTQAHCRSCTCYYNQIENPPEYTISTQTTAPVETGGNVQRINNDDISSRIQNSTVPRNNNFLEYNGPSTSNNYNVGENVNRGSHAVRPNTLNLQANDENSDKMKIELSDDPVIYDERQLNVGTSPIFEDRPTI